MTASAWMLTVLGTGSLPQDGADAGGLGTRDVVFLVLWGVISLAYWLQYRRDEKPLGALLKVGALLGFIWALMTLFDWMVQIVPPEQVVTFGDPAVAAGPRIPIVADIVVWLVGLLLVLVAWHARRKVGTAAALLLSTWDRGHWYVLPVLFILMTLGLLLVAAAASPVLSPFIYTLF